MKSHLWLSPAYLMYSGKQPTSVFTFLQPKFQSLSLHRNCETLIQVTPTLGSTVQNNVSKSLLSNVAAFFPVSFGLVFHVCFLSFGSFGFCLLCVEFVCLIWTAFPYFDFPYIDFLLIDHCLIIWVRLLVLLLPPCFPC